jgi:AraC-like DNA-binding protein
MAENLVPMETLRRMTAPADLFVGTGTARPISVRNVIAFCRMHARELGARKSFHHRFVLCCNVHGSSAITLILGEVALRLSPSRYILFPPHQLHTYAGLDDREIAILFVTFETDDEDMLLHLGNRIMEITPAVRTALSGFVEEYTGDGAARHGSLVVLAAQALLETIIGNDRDSSVEAHLPIPTPLREAMLRLSGLESPTVIAIAREAGLSEAHLRKLFKKHIGVSLGHYLTEMRQNKARSLLGASDESVSRIAERCGYKSVYAFSRSFHTFNDCTPSHYRERIKRRDIPVTSS